MKHSKHTTINKQLLRESLEEFEQLPSLAVRDEWTSTLLQRAQERSSRKPSQTRALLTNLSLCLVVIANIWAAKQVLRHDAPSTPDYTEAQAAAYSAIAKEFLIQSH